MLGQALDRALGKQRGIVRYGYAVVPMDEARAACAIDVSGRPFCGHRGLRPAPPGEIEGFEHEAAEELFRAVARVARLTLHLELQAGTNAHHMIEACFKALARALRAGRDGRPARDGRAVHEGDADGTLIAICDYRMGNRRSVEKALEHVGARVRRHRRPRGDGGRRRPRPPGVGAFPEAMRTSSATGARRRAARAGGGRRARAGRPASGCSCSSRAPPSTRARAGLGLLPGDVTALRARRKLPHIGWNLVRFARAVAADRGAREAAAFYHVHSFACRAADAGDVVGAGEYGELVRVRSSSAGACTGVQFHPEKSSRDGLAPAAQLRRPARGAARDPLSGDRHLRGAGAVRLVQGRFEDQTVYADDPLAAAKRWVRAGARFLHVVDLDGAGWVSRSRSGICGGSRGRRACPCSTAAGCARCGAVREALGAGAERVIVGTAAFRDVDFLDDVVAHVGPRIVVSVDVRGGQDLDLGVDPDDADAGRGRDPAAG